MTRKEALKLAIRACEETWNEKTCKQIRKALEQEPTPNEVLDKIRNEFIVRYPRNYANELELGGRNCVFSLNEILRIIDKYRKKSEDKE